MIRSMTAFARTEAQTQWGQICWELRSVNHRYLEVSLRLPEDARAMEMTLRDCVHKHLKRGKVDATLRLTTETSSQLEVNLPLLNNLCQAIKTVSKAAGQSAVTDPINLLQWPGMLASETPDMDMLHAEVLRQFERTLLQLTEHRAREGTQLADMIAQRCTTISEEVTHIRAFLPEIIAAQREKMHARLSELTELNSERIEQEMVLFAQKMDVAEELDRLDTHLGEILKTLQQDQPVGRRLDFLVQELHREANTLSAKANHITTTQRAVDIKVLIEQIREQTQNIE